MKNPILTSSWEKKMQDKAERQQYQATKQAVINARKQKLQVLSSSTVGPPNSPS